MYPFPFVRFTCVVSAQSPHAATVDESAVVPQPRAGGEKKRPNYLDFNLRYTVVNPALLDITGPIWLNGWYLTVSRDPDLGRFSLSVLGRVAHHLHARPGEPDDPSRLCPPFRGSARRQAVRRTDRCPPAPTRPRLLRRQARP